MSNPDFLLLCLQSCKASSRLLEIGTPGNLQSKYMASTHRLQPSQWVSFLLSCSFELGRLTSPAKKKILLQVASPWQWYCASRTFSNSLETSLTICALAHWPWHLQRQAAVPVKENLKPVPIHLTSLRISLFLAALAVLLRPTNILIWLTAAAYLLPTVFPAQGIILAREALLCGSAALAVSVASDKWYFGFWAFPPYNWLSFNIVKSLAVFYGRNPWHYFLLQGLPLLCTTSLPFVLSALYSPRQSSSPAKTATLKTLVAIVYVTIITLSFISHKEVRFIYPLLPALNILAAPRAASFFTTKSPTPADLQQTTAEPKGRSTASSNRAQQCVLRNKSYLGIGLSINVLLAGYLSYVHQRAPITVLSYLRNDFEQRHPSYVLNAAVSTADEASDKPVDDLFALFLMPCHSTPWRSHLIHPMLSAYALSCDPPLHTLPNTPERDNYRDEADRFYDNPIGFLSTEMFPLLAHETLSNRGLAKPRYIVGYEGIQPWLESFIAETREGKELGLKLTQVWSGYNGLFAEDWRRAGKMIVWDTGLYE